MADWVVNVMVCVGGGLVYTGTWLGWGWPGLMVLLGVTLIGVAFLVTGNRRRA